MNSASSGCQSLHRVWTAIGTANYYLGRLEEAADLFERASEIEPKARPDALIDILILTGRARGASLAEEQSFKRVMWDPRVRYGSRASAKFPYDRPDFNLKDVSTYVNLIGVRGGLFRRRQFGMLRILNERLTFVARPSGTNLISAPLLNVHDPQFEFRQYGFSFVVGRERYKFKLEGVRLFPNIDDNPHLAELPLPIPGGKTGDVRAVREHQRATAKLWIRALQHRRFDRATDL